MSASVQAAAHVVSALLARGVRDVVLCPGSRSAPLAYALAEAESRGLLRLHVRHDERTAAFLALGLARVEPNLPAAVVTTSGTAVANLVPAALEARHANVPLLLVTADRPPRLRGTWANQTSDLQAGLLRPVAVQVADAEPARLSPDELEHLVAAAVAAALGRPGGPVHLNLCFDTPLEPAPGQRVEMACAATVPAASEPIVPGGWPGDRAVLPAGPRTVVVAGDGAGRGARRVAEAGGWPLLAEPTSGARGGSNLVDCYRMVAGRSELVEQVQRVVVLGRPTLSRPITALTERRDVELVHVVRDAGEPGPGRPCRRVREVDVVAPAEPGWLGQWRQAGLQARAHLRRLQGDHPRLAGLLLAEAVAAATGAGDALVLGASNPIRDVDLAAGAIADGALVVANRGLAGIDGTLSTAAGVAVAGGRATRCLVGDLTFLHDLAGLAIPAAERSRLRLQVVVLNDDGGGIFSTLEHAEHADVFERVFATPHGCDLDRLVTGHGHSFRRVQTTELATALAEVRPGVEVLEVRSSRAGLGELSRGLARF